MGLADLFTSKTNTYFKENTALDEVSLRLIMYGLFPPGQNFLIPAFSNPVLLVLAQRLVLELFEVGWRTAAQTYCEPSHRPQFARVLASLIQGAGAVDRRICRLRSARGACQGGFSS